MLPVQVLEPCASSATRVLGDSINGLHTWNVVFLKDNATPAQLRDRGAYVIDLEL